MFKVQVTLQILCLCSLGLQVVLLAVLGDVAGVAPHPGTPPTATLGPRSRAPPVQQVGDILLLFATCTVE